MWLRITEVIYKYIGLNFRLILYIQKFLVILQFIHKEKEVSYMESKTKSEILAGASKGQHVKNYC